MRLPFEVADYVDFYSSLHHASNVGRMFRPDDEPLKPNWRHLPVAYHGRAGTVVVSGTPVVRPCGQFREPGSDRPTFGPTRRLDLEAEVGFVVGVPSQPGRPVPVDALGMLLPDMRVPVMEAAEVAAHEALTRLSDNLLRADAFIPSQTWEREGWQPYEPDALRLYVVDVTGQPIEGGDLPEMVRDWPTDDDPRAFGQAAGEFLGPGTRCGVVEDDLGETWFAELSSANENTLWTTDGVNRFRVLARPLLPHEERSCPEL